ncbi:MAG: carbohydrate-binding family 9-like protein [Bacteroidales bacterium]|jgi:hypothetical protein|nr:carbohydrate-binding family 9-like protein [Bacteroidales bacterium]
MKKTATVNSLLLAFAICFMCPARGLSQQPADNVLVIKKCNDFELTGDGSASEWNKTGWIELTQQGPDKSPYTTRAKVLYSEKGLYFLYDCVDKKLNAKLKGDFLNIFTEDVAEFFLWTDEAYPIYFEYEISPLDYELPIIVPNFNGRAQGWLPWRYEGEKKTRHATTVTGGQKESGATIDGWKAEVFLPYRLLSPLNNVPPVSGTKWRANVYRIDYDHGRTYFTWQKIEKSFHEYEKYGTFLFE